MQKVVKLSRAIHRWLGLISLPLILVIGITGYYLNHRRQVRGILPLSGQSTELFSSPHPDGPRGFGHLIAIKDAVWGNVRVRSFRAGRYRAYETLSVTQSEDPGRRIIMAVESGDFIVRSRYFQRGYRADGTLLSVTISWRRLLDRLHTGGIVQGKYRILWDLLCLSLILLSATGMVLWFVPKLARMKRRRSSGSPAPG
jgi:uncharacterized protein